MQHLLSSVPNPAVNSNTKMSEEKDKSPAKSTPKAKAAPKKRGGATKGKKSNAVAGGATNDTKSLIQQINTLNLGTDIQQSENPVSLRESQCS